MIKRKCDCSRCENSGECESVTGFCNYFKPIYETNADRIRSMSDEELAEIIGILAESNEDCAKCPAVSDKFLCKTCKEGILEWLQSEVEE